MGAIPFFTNSFLFLYNPLQGVTKKTLAGSTIITFLGFSLSFQTFGGKFVLLSIVMLPCRHLKVFWASPKKLVCLF